MRDPRPLLIERVVSAFRERDSQGRIRPEPAFHDLDPAGRRTAFEESLCARRLEAALDRGGLSTTARAVLSRIRD